MERGLEERLEPRPRQVFSDRVLPPPLTVKPGLLEFRVAHRDSIRSVRHIRSLDSVRVDRSDLHLAVKFQHSDAVTRELMKARMTLARHAPDAALCRVHEQEAIAGQVLRERRLPHARADSVRIHTFVQQRLNLAGKFADEIFIPLFAAKEAAHPHD